MNLRSSLQEAIELLDNHPEIETKKLAVTVLSSLKIFREKFDLALEAEKRKRKWDQLRGELVVLSPERLGGAVREMEEKELAEFSKYFGMKPAKATKKLTARENAEAKLLKKIKEIGKQLH
jgi:hypothetical protein